MELETFLCAQPWLVPLHRPLTKGSSSQEGSYTINNLNMDFHGMFFITNEAFCTFSPSIGDQTQFDCIFATDFNKDGIDSIPQSCIIVSIQEKQYWIDHTQLENHNITIIDQIPLPLSLILDFGIVRFRIWTEQSLGKKTQQDHLLQLISLIRQHTKMPLMSPPVNSKQFAIQHEKSPLDALIQYGEQHPLINLETKVKSIEEICLNYDLKHLHEKEIRGRFMADLLLGKVSIGMELIQYMINLPFSISCNSHDDCFQIGKEDVCTTGLWHNWERYLEAKRIGEPHDHAMSLIEQRTMPFCAAMACPKLYEKWTQHGNMVKVTLDVCQRILWRRFFPESIRQETDQGIREKENALQVIKDAKKKRTNDELSLLLLPGKKRRATTYVDK